MNAALITGAAKRLGNYMALALAKEGYDLAINYNSSTNEARELQKEIEQMGQTCVLFQGDVQDSEFISTLIPQVLKDLPHLNVLINNASIYPPMPFLQTSKELFEQCFSIHVKAPFFLSQSFAKHIKKGQIVNITDTQIRKNRVPHFAYHLSKQALGHLTEMLAVELAPGIKVNEIAPGHILKPSTDGPQPTDAIPLERMGNPEDICKALLFILEHSYLTGQTLYIDGGQTL